MDDSRRNPHKFEEVFITYLCYVLNTFLIIMVNENLINVKINITFDKLSNNYYKINVQLNIN